MKKEKTMFRVKLSFQHSLNPLHVYCRLVPVIGKSRARAFSSRYETIYRRIL